MLATQEIEDMGFEAAPVRLAKADAVQLHIYGMTCAIVLSPQVERSLTRSSPLVLQLRRLRCFDRIGPAWHTRHRFCRGITRN